MPTSPGARPRRATHGDDVRHPPATAESGRHEAGPDESDQHDAEHSDGADQAEPDPPDEGWEPV